MLGIDVEAIALRLALGLDEDESPADVSPKVKRDCRSKTDMPSNTADSSNSSANKSSNMLAEALSSTLAYKEEKETNNFTKNKLLLDSLINEGCMTSRKGSFATDNCHLNLK